MPTTVQQKKSKSKYDYSDTQSLCWDCRNSTRPWICPWAGKYRQVKDWKAKPTRVSPKSSPFDSFNVLACPGFKRDSYCGGLVDPPNKRRVTIDADDVPNLAEAVIEQAVTDWIALDYGELDSLRFCGQLVERDKLLEFFFSKWFEILLESFSERTPQQIRRAIKIPGNTIKTWRGW